MSMIHKLGLGAFCFIALLVATARSQVLFFAQPTFSCEGVEQCEFIGASNDVARVIERLSCMIIVRDPSEVANLRRVLLRKEVAAGPNTGQNVIRQHISFVQTEDAPPRQFYLAEANPLFFVEPDERVVVTVETSPPVTSIQAECYYSGRPL